VKFCNADTNWLISKATAFCLTALCALFLASCQTPAKKKVAAISTEEQLLSEVQYTIAEEKFGPEIKCIAVGEIELTDDSEDFSELNKVELVRRTLVGNLFQQNYTQIPLTTVDGFLNDVADPKKLLNKTDCDALISGEIYRFTNKSYVAASSTEVGLDLTISNIEGEVIWSGRHLATSRDGSLPFSPLSLLSGVFLAQANASNEVALQMVDAAVRRLVDTLPPQSEVSLAVAKNEQAVQELFIPAKTVQTQEAASATDLLESGQYEAAIQAAKLELQSGKNEYQNLLIIGDANRYLNRFDDAVESYLSAIAHDKNQSEGYEKLSLGYLNLRRIDLAKASLSKAISLNPESSAIRYKLAIINESQNANNEAAKLYFQAGELAIREKSNEGIYSSLTALERLSDTEYGQALYNSLLSRAEAYQQKELNTGA
jgi:cytochrome c-type biogenesis protein CcmH/NrfG